MKTKILLILTSLFVSFANFLQSQTRNRVPEKLYGYWFFETQNPSDWDGPRIEKNFIEYLYQVYYIEKTDTLEGNGFHFKLKNEFGKKIELTVNELNDDTAKFKFTNWEQPKTCHRNPNPKDQIPFHLNELPNEIFGKWATDNSRNVFCEFYDKDKVFLENKTWTILTSGLWKEREIRMLINSGDFYKLIYLKRSTERKLNLAFDLKNFILTPVIQQQKPINNKINQILGNWVNEKENKWNFGFYERFAVYNGDFWEYEKLNQTSKRLKIELRKGSEKINVMFAIIGDTLSQISVNGGEAEPYFKCSKTIPEYKVIDNKLFKDSRFLSVDTVTIKGYLRNLANFEPFSVSFIHPGSSDYTTYYADIDSLGRFTIKFPMINTSEVILDRDRMLKITVLEPGETIFIFYDFECNQFFASGKNERIHNELMNYKPFTENSIKTREEFLKIQNLTPMEFLKIKHEYLVSAKKHLIAYIQTNPFVSEKFRYYQLNYYRFKGLRDLMQKRFSLNYNKGEKFPMGFIEYVDSAYANNPPLPFTLTGNFFDYTRDYYDYKNSLSPFINSVSFFDALLYLHNQKRLILNSEDLINLKNKIESEKIFLNEKYTGKLDTIKLNKLGIIDENKITSYFKNEIFKSFIQKEWNKVSSEILNERHFYNQFESIDSLISDSLIKEITKLRYVLDFINDSHLSLTSVQKEKVSSQISNPIFNQMIESLNNQYSKIEKLDIRFIESLKKTDHLKEAKNADSLFLALTKPYRGKVIYIDFWGTWCGPCREMMKYVSPVKEALKGKEVIFMYFANGSPENSWKSIIKEYNLTGENVVHYNLPAAQQNMIERRFSINSFPTYLLMDKEGRIVNNKAPSPMFKSELLVEIDKLLK